MLRTSLRATVDAISDQGSAPRLREGEVTELGIAW